MRLNARFAMVAIAAVLVGGAFSAGTATGVVPGGAVSGRAVVMTFNMCGEQCNKDNTAAPITSLMTTIDTEQPAVVFLQEVCRHQYNALKTLSAVTGNWRLYGYTDVTNPHGCDGGKDTFGDAILTHTPFSGSTVHSYALKYPFEGETRKVMCLSASSMPRLTEVCTVHAGLPYEITFPHQTTQIHEAYQHARADAHGGPLVLGGDFNAVPTANALDALYFTGGGGAHGTLLEVNACPLSEGGRAHHSATCNEHTQGTHKHDYIFVSHTAFKDLKGKPLTTSFSDHVPLVGTMTECAVGGC
jgi:endonuclease/exonuclease/phosphatase family metal-dependent hydrolase